MTRSALLHLNRLLRDHLGTTPAGGSLYEWLHSRDERLFCFLGRLNSATARAEYERIPQVWEQRWVMARWMPPPSPQTWEAQFQGQVAYPRGGYHIACSIPSDPLLEMGVEPNERITMYTIHLRKKQMAMTLAQIERSFAESRAHNKRNEDREVDACLTDRWTNCEVKVPGAAEQLAGL